MSARGLMQAGALPVRFAAVAAVWVAAALMLGQELGSPLPVFALTSTSILVLAFVFMRQYEPEPLPRPAQGARTPPLHHASEAEDADPATESFTEHFVAKEFAAASRGRDVTLVMFGFSRFDEFAEQEGYMAAGEALREFGRVLQRMTRQMNLTARYGWRADSFLSVLSGANAVAAEVYIRRVREAAAASKVRMPGIDAGIATWQPHLASPDEFVACAQQALDAARAAHQPSAGPRTIEQPGTWSRSGDRTIV